MKAKEKFGERQHIKDPEKAERFLREICAHPPKNTKDLEQRKNEFAKREKTTTLLNRDLIAVAQKQNIKLPPALEPLLQKRSVRTISGVSPIGILTKPSPCPGQCVYCPTEARMPKSYLANQPAAARAVRNKFHPYTQVKNRITALSESGHPVSKLEVIVMGGTWSYLPKRYQMWYIKNIFMAANNTPHVSNLKIQNINKKDWKEVLDLEKITLEKVGFGETPQEHDFDMYQRFCKAFWVGKIDEKIVVMGGYKNHDKNTAEIKRFRVHPDFQNQGIGQQFFRYMLQTIEKQGVKKILLNFSSLLTPKNKYFYEKFGFHEIRRETEARGDRLFYEKQIETSQKTSLSKLQKINETAERRIIGLTLETRPDYITEKELIRMRQFGCTRIEVGVQTLNDKVSKLTKRGHDREQVAQAMKLMKDFGFKVCAHLMPGLPGSGFESDLEMLREVFENPDFRPDFVKIYPCVVLDNSELKQWWEAGKYKPMDDATLARLLLEFKKSVPPWTRIMRLMRDIPVSSIRDGAQLSNLRQIIKSQPKKLTELIGENREWPCQCIRCREVGFLQGKNARQQISPPVLTRRDYEASGGQEVFLSFESADRSCLYALLRLRKPSGQHFSRFGSVLHEAALIREVHAYGSEISVGEGEGLGQHRGLGRKLLQEAENIAREEWGLKKISIIAGVGTRDYYRKFGYKLRSTYMTKTL